MPIAPDKRLLLYGIILFLPLTLLAGVLPETRMVLLPLLAILSLLTTADAIAGQRRLRQVQLKLPAVVRLSKDRAAEFDVYLSTDLHRELSIRFGLPLPAAFEADQELLNVRIPAAATDIRFSYRCTARRRGRFLVENCFIDSASPLGLWRSRRPVPCHIELRVYPNLLAERGGVSALFLNRGGFGLHAQRQVGQGHDFERLREYSPGDNYDEIYWKATARRGFPVTKVFQIERTQEVYVVIDASRLSSRQLASAPLPLADATTDSSSSPPQAYPDTLLARFINAALTLGVAAEKQGDLFGLVVFSDRIQQFIRARAGKNHYAACRDALYTLEPELVTPDFSELFTAIRTRLRRRALLIFLTSLDDPVLAEAFQKDAQLVCRHHLMLVNMVRQPQLAPLFTQPELSETADIYRHLSGHLRWHGLREIARKLQQHGIQFSLLDNEKLCAETVTQYMNVKRRQLL